MNGNVANYRIHAKDRAVLVTIMRQVKSHYARVGEYNSDNYELNAQNKTLTLTGVHPPVVERACQGFSCKKVQF
jgi:hypothetical protein